MGVPHTPSPLGHDLLTYGWVELLYERQTLIHYSRITYSLSLSHLKSTITNLSSPPRISYRRCKNVLDILVRAKHRRQAPPASGAFCHRNKCKTCPFIREGTTSYTFFSTKEQRDIRHHITCSSSNLVYMIQCNKCNAQCKYLFWEKKRKKNR